MRKSKKEKKYPCLLLLHKYLNIHCEWLVLNLKNYLTNRLWCLVTLNPKRLYWSSISTWLWRANVSIIIIPQISKNQIRSIEHMAVIPALLHKTRNLCSDTLWVTQWSSGQSFVKTRSGAKCVLRCTVFWILFFQLPA